jgi:hypothetical protein
MTTEVQDHPAFTAPRHGVHRAGEMVDRLQRCAICGDLLAHVRHAPDYPEDAIPGRVVPFTRYVPGDLIERGRGWQAIALAAKQPTCGG